MMTPDASKAVRSLVSKELLRMATTQREKNYHEPVDSLSREMLEAAAKQFEILNDIYLNYTKEFA